jgi:iron complex outermembrane receptor protein
MKKKLSIILALLPLLLFGQQQYQVSGKVYDASNTGESLIGVNVVYGKGLGVITDFNGNYVLNLFPGKYSVQFSYVGYEKSIVEVTVKDKDQVIDVSLNTLQIDEVIVVADVARSRQTPVAFSTIQPNVLQISRCF